MFPPLKNVNSLRLLFPYYDFVKAMRSIHYVGNILMVLISNSQGKYTVVRVCLIMSRICSGCLTSMTFNQGLRPLFLSYQEIGGLGQILRENRLYCFPIATMVKASRFVHDGQNILMAHMSNFYDKDPLVRACLNVFKVCSWQI